MACVRDSKISMTEAESRVLEFLEKYTLSRECPLTGKSVHSHLPFLEAYMPRIANYFRFDSIIDVSTITKLSQSWCPGGVRNFARKNRAFRSLDDILEDIRELKYFHGTIFRCRGEETEKSFQIAAAMSDTRTMDHPMFEAMMNSRFR